MQTILLFKGRRFGSERVKVMLNDTIIELLQLFDFTYLGLLLL